MSDKIDGIGGELPTEMYSISFKLPSKENWREQLEFIENYLETSGRLIEGQSNSKINQNGIVTRNSYALNGNARITIFNRSVRGNIQSYSIMAQFMKGDVCAIRTLEAIAGELCLIRV